jgi:serine/threonine protein kinase
MAFNQDGFLAELPRTIIPTLMPLAPGTQLGPYEIVSPLGAGGMGEVYRARDEKLKRDVALKVLPELVANDTQRTLPAKVTSSDSSNKPILETLARQVIILRTHALCPWHAIRSLQNNRAHWRRRNG